MRRLAHLALYASNAGVVLVLGKIHAKYIGFYSFHGSFRFAWSIAYIAILCIAAYGVGLPDVPRNAYVAMWTAAGATITAALGISVVQLVVGSALLPRFVVFSAAVILVPVDALCCFIAAKDRRRQLSRDRVVAVIGADEVAALVSELSRYPERRATVVWAVEAGSAAAHDGVRPLLEAALDSSATVVVLDRAAQNDETIVAQAAELHEHGVRIRTLSLFYDEWLGKLPINELERVSLMFDIGEVHRIRYGRVKRVLDVGVAVAGVPVLLLAVPFVLLGNLAGNRGSLLYRQPRVGKGGVVFQIAKFRTMRPSGAAPGSGADWTTDDDPRITPFGRLLRRTHVDELPQIINILRGDLAVVGPRPEQPRYVEELTEKIPFYGLRHLVRPGLTGWAQVKYPYASSELDALEKLQYEFFYLRHQGLGLDVRIIVRTIRSVVGRMGR